MVAKYSGFMQNAVCFESPFEFVYSLGVINGAYGKSST
jgi:hypothetical protein